MESREVSMNRIGAELALYGFMAALTVCRLFSASGHDRDERKELEAHELILNSLPDADTVGQIELHTIKNLRDQTTPEEMADFDENRRLLQMGDRRN